MGQWYLKNKDNKNMCQQIKIDRSNIERNPNGGRTSINKPLGRVVYKFKINLKLNTLK